MTTPEADTFARMIAGVTYYETLPPTEKIGGCFAGEPDAQRDVIYNNSLTLL